MITFSERGLLLFVHCAMSILCSEALDMRSKFSGPELFLISNLFSKGKGTEKKIRICYGLLPNPPPDPPPPHGLFTETKLPLFFLSEIRSQMGETNFTFGPIPKFYFFVL